MTADQLSAADVVRDILWRRDFSDPVASDADVEGVERFADQRCAQLRADLQASIEREAATRRELEAEVKRLKIGALNDANEITQLRAELKHARQVFEDAGLVWP